GEPDGRGADQQRVEIGVDGDLDGVVGAGGGEPVDEEGQGVTARLRQWSGATVGRQLESPVAGRGGGLVGVREGGGDLDVTVLVDGLETGGQLDVLVVQQPAVEPGDGRRLDEVGRAVARQADAMAPAEPGEGGGNAGRLEELVVGDRFAGWEEGVDGAVDEEG